MSIAFKATPAEFQPVLSDGIYFTLSSDTYNPLTTFKFKYNYELYVEDALVFEGKCSPNPFGLGILDLQQILETYTDSLPLSYWNTTPIYTHQTFPFSRPLNQETINYYVRVGYEYADSEIGLMLSEFPVGWRCDPSSPEQLAAVIDEICHSPVHLTEKTPREVFLRNYSEDVVLSKISSTLRDVVDLHN
jgi:hypothetical protein